MSYYKDNESLPDKVKKLETKAQDLYRETYNKIYKDTEDMKKSLDLASYALELAGYADPKYTLDAEIMSVGVWNGDKFTSSDLESMIQAFNELKGEVKPPIKFGHNDQQPLTDGMPALGWVTALRINGDKLIATLTDMPKIVYDAIKRGLYKRVSSEVYFNLKSSLGKTYKRVLAGVALLGADIPAVKNIADLQAYLSERINEDSFQRIATYAFNMEELKINHKKKEKQMGDEDEVREYKEQLAKEKEEKDKLKAEKEESDRKLKEFTEKQAKQKKEDGAKSVKEYCEARVKEGKMTPAQRDLIVPDKMNYSDETGFSISFDSFKEFNDLADKLDDDEHGKNKNKNKKGTYEDAGAEVHKRAEKYERDNKVAYADAIQAVLNDDPKLAEAYEEEGNINVHVSD